MITFLLLVVGTTTTFPVQSSESADTLRFSCEGHSHAGIAPALSGEFTLRTTYTTGEVAETSIHAILVRDTTAAGISGFVFEGNWRHSSGRQATERIVFCRQGSAPISLAYRGRSQLNAEFAGNIVQRREGDGSETSDTLPVAAFPYTAFHVVAFLQAAGPDGSTVVPLYRDEDSHPGERFQWARVDTRSVPGTTGMLREVTIHAFGGATRFYFEPAPLRLVLVQLNLASGETIEEVRR